MKDLTEEQKVLIFQTYLLGLRILKSGKGNKNNKANYELGINLLPNLVKQLDK